MANIKSAKKDIKTTEKKTIRNNFVKTTIKNLAKKIEKAVNVNDKETASASYAILQKKVDTAANKGIVSKQMAARKKSRLNKKIKSLA